MKYIYIIILIWLLSFSFVSAQKRAEIWELDSPVNGTETYLAKEYISLVDGFSYTPGANESLSLEIDPNLFFAPNNTSYITEDGEITTDPTEGSVVGNIPGQFNVSGTGAATYTIPIECPKGINGLQPNISLVYNSQSGNGIAGWGWNISGLSQITRTRKNYYFDQEAAPIDWTKESPLSLDGQRLIIISKSDDQIEYKTESESFNKIIGTNLQAWGPKIITVYTKDGKTLTYGGDEDVLYLPINNNKRLGWRLSTIEDKNGNLMTFQYSMQKVSYNFIDNTVDQVYLDQVLESISYGSNANIGNSDDFKINFIYETRDDEESGFIDRTYHSQSKRLSKIESSSYGKSFRTYEISYSENEIGKSIIGQITEYGTNGEKLSPISIKYNAINQEISGKEISLSGIDDTFSTGDYYWYSADITGDGLSDLITIYPAKLGTAQKTAIHTYTAYKNDDGGLNFKSNIIDYSPIVNSAMDNLVTKSGNLQVGNFEDKQQTCFIPYLDRGEDYYCNFLVYDINKKNTRFRTSLKTITSDMPSYTFADFNNDGYTDVFYIEKKKYDDTFPGLIIWGAEMETRDIIATTELEFSLSKAPKQIIPSDYNADGLIDFMVITSNDAKFYINQGGELNSDSIINCSFKEKDFTTSEYFKEGYSSYLRSGDFNGDGLLDFIINKKNTKDWSFFINTGNLGFYEHELEAITAKEDDYTSANNSQDDCIVFDFNNDGKDDVLITESHYKTASGLSSSHPFDYAYTAWYESTGTNVTLYKKIDTGRKYVTDTQYAVGDFNGDGRPDIISYAYDLSTFEEKDENIHFVSTENNDYGEGLVSTISNSSGKNIEIYYSPLTNNNVYTKGTDDYTEIMNLQAPLYVTQKVTGFDNISTEYSYNEAYFHLRGKGFLGFKENSIKNLQTGFVSTSINQINTDFATLVPLKTEVSIGSTIINTTENNISVLDQGNNRYWAKVNSATSTDALTNTSKNITYTYDDYGNPISITTEYLENGENIGIYQNQTISYTDKGSWCDYLPEKIYTSKFNSDDSQIRTTEYSYDLNGNLTKQIHDPEDDNKLILRYDNYDSFGNPQKIEKEWNSNIRSTSLTYTSSGRFVHTKTNDFTGFTNTYNYDEETGLLDSEEDHIGLITSYQYDDFGRNTVINYPDGTYTVKALQWNNGDGPTNALFYNYEESSGQSPLWTWYDDLGRIIRKDYYGYKRDSKIFVTTSYNNKGQKDYVSEPYAAEMGQKTSYTYDDYGRVDKIVSPAGTTSYTYDGLTNTTTSPNGKTIETKNAAGQLVSSSVNGRVVDFTYWPSGQVKTSTPEGGVAVTTNYNLQGNRIEIVDPDGGIVTSEYNGFGELTLEQFVKTDEDGNQDTITTKNYYDDAGRNISSNVNGVNTTTDYNPTSGTINAITNSETGHQISYKYDDLGRITTTTENINDELFTFGTTYDSYGREESRTYPSGYSVTYKYTETGQLEQVLDPSGNNIWQGVSVYDDGQFKECKKGSKSINFTYENERRLPQTIKSDGIIDMYYEFKEDGNLDYRKDYISGNSESFNYDDYNQLESWTIERDGTSSSFEFLMNYDKSGNITSKTGIDFSMNYDDNTKIHAITSISGNPDIISDNTQIITYNDFKKISSITEGNNTVNITYGVDNYRRVGVFNAGQSDELTKFYLGDYEEDHSENSVKKIHYISGGNGLAAIYIDNNKEGSLFHAYTDYQGSLLALTDEDGNIATYNDSEQRFAYDPWGNRRDPDKWEDSDIRASWLTERGYTMHEHLNNFALINMNGRVYDPLIARFLSPDPQLQAPGNWLNYNRYTYCLNNPMLYTDPSGEWFGWDDLVAAGVGFIAGYVSYGMTTDNWGGKAFAAGGITATVSWVGWNTLGAGSAALKHGAGSATTFSQGTSAVFSSAGGNYGYNYAAITATNAFNHQDQLKTADKKGWNGVWAMGAYSASAALGGSLNPTSKIPLNGLQQFAGVVISDNISDNMENGEFNFHSFHVGLIGWDSEREDKTWGGFYSIFSSGLDAGDRFNMAYESVLGLSAIKSDIKYFSRGKRNHIHQYSCDYTMPSQLRLRYIRTAWLGRLGRSIKTLWNAYSIYEYNKTLEQYWYDKNYNEDGSAIY